MSPVAGLLLLGICGLSGVTAGCHSEPERTVQPLGVQRLQDESPQGAKAPPTGFPSASSSRGEGEAPRAERRGWEPPQQLPQTMAFSRYRWAWLHDELVRVWRTGDFREVAHFKAPGARALQVLTGGGFVADGKTRLYRLSPMGHRPRSFARVPRLGPTRLFASSRDSRTLLLHFDSSDRIWEFSLTDDSELVGEPEVSLVLPTLPLQAMHSLPGFDRRALSVLRDGSVVYTRPGGLGRRYPGQRLETISVAFDGPVWSLLPGRAVHEVWVATPQRLSRLVLQGERRGEVVQFVELPADTLAVDSSRTRIAWLSLADAARGRYQVDVRSLLSDRAWVVRGDVVASRARVELRPELRLASTKDLLSLWLGELQVVEYARDRVALRVRSAARVEADRSSLADSP